MRIFATAFVLALLLLLLGGCERGCLFTWLKDQGLGGVRPQSKGGVPLAELACPEGLARCSAGRVHVSRAYTPPSPCSPEGCKCPWDDGGTCARGCVLDGVEMGFPPSIAARQLCAPPPGLVFSQAAPPGFVFSPPAPPSTVDADAPLDLGIACEVEHYRCEDGVVSACSDGGRVAVAICTKGCAEGERMILDDVAVGTAPALLCAR